MYLQGGAIWHPRCGPGPTENGQVLNGTGEANGHLTDNESRGGDVSGREFDRMSSSGVSEMQVKYAFAVLLFSVCIFIVLDFHFLIRSFCVLFFFFVCMDVLVFHALTYP